MYLTFLHPLEMEIEDGTQNYTAMIAVFFNGKEVFNEAVKKGFIKKLSLDVRNVFATV